MSGKTRSRIRKKTFNQELVLSCFNGINAWWIPEHIIAKDHEFYKNNKLRLMIENGKK